MSALSIERILCPVDFSEESTHALRYASELAAHFGAEIIVVHAVEPLPYPVEFGPLPAILTDAEPVLLKRAKEQLEALRSKELGALPKSRVVVEIGVPEHAICEAAKRERCDLVVLSTHGRSGLSHLLIGSVAERVLRFAPCPVLTIKPKAK
jgi:universal stress protein A